MQAELIYGLFLQAGVHGAAILPGGTTQMFLLLIFLCPHCQGEGPFSLFPDSFVINTLLE